MVPGTRFSDEINIVDSAAYVSPERPDKRKKGIANQFMNKFYQSDSVNPYIQDMPILRPRRSLQSSKNIAKS
jgi:hypothetical protein